jgi:glycosyltransferase involved in cell wall biosynthesis
MGIVLFEALACGTPVLSVDCPGGIREILKGELEVAITPHSVEGLAAGMREALSNEAFEIDEEWLDDFRPARIAEAFVASGPAALSS